MGKFPKLADTWPGIVESVRYLMVAGKFTDFQAAALGGQIVRESLGASWILGDDDSAVGLFQWRGDRREGLKRLASSRGSTETDRIVQLDWALEELRNTHRSTGDALRKTTTVEDACAVAIGYCRPKGWSKKNPRNGDGWAKRLEYSRKLLAEVQGAAQLKKTEASITEAKATVAAKAPAKVYGPFETAIRLSPKRLLEFGDNSDLVKVAQLELADYGFPLTGTGYFGQATLAAVKELQRIEHLVQDGVIGPITAARLDFYKGRQLPTPPAITVEITRALWLSNGLRELGITEKAGPGSNPTLMRWAKAEGGLIAKALTDDDIAWCSMYANHLLTAVGLPGTEDLWALNWDSDTDWPNVRIPTSRGYALGAFMPMRRDGGGHITVLAGRDQHGNFMGLGGNQNNMVSIAPYAPSRILSHRWPKSVPVPPLLSFNQLPIIRSDGRVVSEA